MNMYEIFHIVILFIIHYLKYIMIIEETKNVIFKKKNKEYYSLRKIQKLFFSITSHFAFSLICIGFFL